MVGSDAYRKSFLESAVEHYNRDTMFATAAAQIGATAVAGHPGAKSVLLFLTVARMTRPASRSICVGTVVSTARERRPSRDRSIRNVWVGLDPELIQ
jgi:hypothetical protein